MNVASFLTKAARTFAERPAVSLGTEPYLTYGALVLQWQLHDQAAHISTTPARRR
jgi:hypothetical protein